MGPRSATVPEGYDIPGRKRALPRRASHEPEANASPVRVHANHIRAAVRSAPEHKGGPGVRQSGADAGASEAIITSGRRRGRARGVPVGRWP
ncbi:hypothetical protein GCM10009783_40070 [Glycomyces lechevalierae]